MKFRAGQLDVLGVAAVHLSADLTGEVLAQGLAVHAAPAAAPAGEVVIRRHGCAFCEAFHARAHLRNLRGNFVSDHEREIPAHAPRPGVLDRKPRAAGQHARHGLARPRHGDGPLLQNEGRARLRQYHRLHVVSCLVKRVKNSSRSIEHRAPHGFTRRCGCLSPIRGWRRTTRPGARGRLRASPGAASPGVSPPCRCSPRWL